tara:strand:- start:8428 stop:8691 length:264 start_codon:yes stop_codon:yes gene_type:complete
MIKVRLARRGANKRPFYHIVVADSRKSRDGRYIEKIGYFNPIAKGQEKRIMLDAERLQYWLGVGAQATDRVRSVVKENKRTSEKEAA